MKYFLLGTLGLVLSTVAGASNSGLGESHSARASLSNVVVSGTETDGGPGDCSFVTINVQADVEGINDLADGNDQIRISVFDDGIEEAFEVVSVPVGTTETVDVTLSFEGLVGETATGVGILIWDGPTTSGSTLFSEDPFIPETISGSCAGPALPVPVNSAWMLGALTLLLALMAFAAMRVRENA